MLSVFFLFLLNCLHFGATVHGFRWTATICNWQLVVSSRSPHEVCVHLLALHNNGLLVCKVCTMCMLLFTDKVILYLDSTYKCVSIYSM